MMMVHTMMICMFLQDMGTLFNDSFSLFMHQYSVLNFIIMNDEIYCSLRLILKQKKITHTVYCEVKP